MMDTNSQPAELKPMAINMKLKWEVEPEDVIQTPDGGAVENKIVNQIITPTTVLTIYCQVVNTTIGTVDEVEESIIDSVASGHYG